MRNVEDDTYRDWQLDSKCPMLICINCFKLVEREYPMQHRCKECHKKYNPRKRIKRKEMRKCRDQRIKKRTIRDSQYIPPKLWAKTQPKVCNICGHDIIGIAEIDHIIPLANNGVHHPRNWQLLCRDCHIIKTTGENACLHLGELKEIVV